MSEYEPEFGNDLGGCDLIRVSNDEGATRLGPSTVDCPKDWKGADTAVELPPERLSAEPCQSGGISGCYLVGPANQRPESPMAAEVSEFGNVFGEQAGGGTNSGPVPLALVALRNQPLAVRCGEEI